MHRKFFLIPCCTLLLMVSNQCFSAAAKQAILNQAKRAGVTISEDDAAFLFSKNINATAIKINPSIIQHTLQKRLSAMPSSPYTGQETTVTEPRERSRSRGSSPDRARSKSPDYVSRMRRNYSEEFVDLLLKSNLQGVLYGVNVPSHEEVEHTYHKDMLKKTILKYMSLHQKTPNLNGTPKRMHMQLLELATQLQTRDMEIEEILNIYSKLYEKFMEANQKKDDKAKAEAIRGLNNLFVTSFQTIPYKSDRANLLVNIFKVAYCYFLEKPMDQVIIYLKNIDENDYATAVLDTIKSIEDSLSKTNYIQIISTDTIFLRAYKKTLFYSHFLEYKKIESEVDELIKEAQDSNHSTVVLQLIKNLAEHSTTKGTFISEIQRKIRNMTKLEFTNFISYISNYSKREYVQTLCFFFEKRLRFFEVLTTEGEREDPPLKFRFYSLYKANNFKGKELKFTTDKDQEDRYLDLFGISQKDSSIPSSTPSMSNTESAASSARGTPPSTPLATPRTEDVVDLATPMKTIQDLHGELDAWAKNNNMEAIVKNFNKRIGISQEDKIKILKNVLELTKEEKLSDDHAKRIKELLLPPSSQTKDAAAQVKRNVGPLSPEARAKISAAVQNADLKRQQKLNLSPQPQQDMKSEE